MLFYLFIEIDAFYSYTSLMVEIINEQMASDSQVGITDKMR